MASPDPQSLQKIILINRIMGLVFVLLGGLSYFNIANMGEALIGPDPESIKILGGSFVFIGILDIILVPRLMEKILGADKK